MQDYTVLYLAGAMTATLLLVASVLAFRLLHRTSPSHSEIVPRVVRFQPMQRLLREADFEFLAAQPGFRPEVARLLRARRAQIMRKYIHQISAEFDRLHLALRLLALQAHRDRPDIARELVVQKLLFQRRMFEIRVRLALFGYGIKPAHLGELVRTVDALRGQVESLSRAMPPVIQAAPSPVAG
jgi:hypothetical protein